MLNRIKAAFKAFRDGGAPPVLHFDVSKLTPNQLTELTKGGVISVARDQLIGDGNAEFLGEGSSEEFEEQEKKDNGQHGIFGIGL